MAGIWDEAKLKDYIKNRTQESLTLDYKAADALKKTPGKKTEITKDVSAMANSAGGIIVYGIAERQDKQGNRVPDKLDAVDQTGISKEWLEHVINNIQPKIDGLIIHVVELSSGPNDVAYVVEIPQSTTAHQAQDKRYYKRYNFESVAMDNYEIRDVMGRGQFPKVKLTFEIIKRLRYASYELEITATNTGAVYAQYISIFIRIPYQLTDLNSPDPESLVTEDGVSYHEYRDSNLTGGYFAGVSTTRLYVPLLPGLACSWNFSLTDEFEQISLNDLTIKWDVYADNAPPSTGQTPLSDIPIIEQ